MLVANEKDFGIKTRNDILGSFHHDICASEIHSRFITVLHTNLTARPDSAPLTPREGLFSSPRPLRAGAQRVIASLVNYPPI